AGQSVTRTILAKDGGVATTVVSPINIDTTKPTVRTKGHGARLRCAARDTGSGVARCTVRRSTHGTTVRYVVTAVDRAGNQTTKRGHYTAHAYFVVGAPYRDGYFVVHGGHNYIVEADTGSAAVPHYLDGGPGNVAPRGGGFALQAAG